MMLWHLFLLLAGGPVRTDDEMPPLAMYCEDKDSVLTMQDTPISIYCIWNKPALVYHKASNWVSQASLAGPGPTCDWYIDRVKRVLESTSWNETYAMRLWLPPSPSELTVQCQSAGCVLPDCRHHPFTINFVEQDIRFFLLIPAPTPIYQFEEVAFGWCARLGNAPMQFYFNPRPDAPSRSIFMFQKTVLSEEQIPSDLRQTCSLYWNFRLDFRYTRLGEQTTSLTSHLFIGDPGSPPLSITVQVEPRSLRIFSATYSVKSEDDPFRVTWYLTPLSAGSVAYELCAAKSAGTWSMDMEKQAEKTDFCTPPPSLAVDRIHFLLNAGTASKQRGMVSLVLHNVEVKLNTEMQSIVLNLDTPRSKAFSFGVYFASREAIGVQEHYIILNKRDLWFLFQFVFKLGQLSTIHVHLHMNRIYALKPLSDMNLEIHLFNSGPVHLVTPVNVVWFIPLEDPLLQCKWSFTLEVYGSNKAYVFKTISYNYQDGRQDAAAFIPKSVLTFNPKHYMGFVTTVKFLKSGPKPAVLKASLGSYTSKVLETLIHCIKLPCEIRKLGIQKPIDPIPMRTLKKGDRVTLYTLLDLHCPAAENLEIQWKIYQIPTITSVPNWDSFVNIPAISPTNKCPLVVPRFALNIGLHLFNVSIKINIADDENPVMYQSDVMFLDVIQSDLQARIEGGSHRSVGFRDSWTLSGLHSADPDSQVPLDGLSFTWYCTQSASDYETMTLSQNAACSSAQVGLTWMNPNLPMQTVNPETLAFNKDYFFRLVITKGGRTAYADQTVSIVLGKVPQLTVVCIENCGNVLIPTKRFILSAVCLDCLKDGRKPHYEWLLYTNNINVAKFDWVTYSSTGRFEPYISINALSFLDSVDKSYTLGLKLTTWYGAVGYLKYSFIVNAPPRLGSCNIKPARGTSLVTLYVVYCSGFSDGNIPLTYRVIAASPNTSRISSLREDVLGTIAYYGYNPVTLPFFLPIGEASKNNKLPVYVFVYDSLGSFSQVALFATVRDLSRVTPKENVFNTLIDLTSGAQAPMTFYLASGDYEKAGHLIFTVASVLNNDISFSPADHLEASRIKLREELLLKSSSIAAVDISAINQIVTSISEVTKNSKELSMKSQQTAVGKLKEVGTELSKWREEIIGSEQAEQLITGIIAALSSVMVATLQDIDKENIATVSPEKIIVLKEILSVLGIVTEIVMVGKVPGEGNTLMETESFVFHLKKDELWDISNAFKTKECKNCFHPALDKAVQGMSNDSIVSSVFYEFKENPVPWLQNGRDIETAVTGFQMRVNTGKGTSTNLIPERADMILAIKNPTLIERLSIVLGPDPIQSDITSGEVGFEFDTNRASDLLLQFFPAANINFNVSLHLGYNSSGSAPLAFYELGQVPCENGGTGQTGDANLIKLPLKSIIQATSQGRTKSAWNLTLLLQSNFHTSRYTDTLLNVSLVHYSCLHFDASSERWNERACEVGPLSDNIQTHCICHFTQPKVDARADAIGQNIQTFFSGRVWVPPNVVDFRRVNLTELQRNLVALSTVLFIFAVYIILAVWAMKQDKIDRITKDQVVILPDNDPFDKECYLVTVYTGSRCGAGTSADVFIKLVGVFSESRVHLLKHPHYTAFQRGGLDTFLLTTKYYLGDLYFIRIWHNNKGGTPGWFLSRVKVEHMYTKQTWYFMCRKWLAVDKSDDLIDRTFAVANPAFPLRKKDFFLINISASIEYRHLWVSVFALVMAGPFNRLQRLSCCLAVLMCTLLSSIVLYNIETKQDDVDRVGRLLRSIIVGVESSLVTVPVDLLLNSLFRYSQRRRRPNTYIPYNSYTEFKSNGRSAMPNDASFWVSHVQPRGWKDYLQAWYIKEESAKPVTAIFPVSHPQTVSPTPVVRGKTFNNCVVSESVANEISTENEEAFHTNTGPLQDRANPNKNNQNNARINDSEGSSKKNKHKNLCNACFILLSKKPEIVYSWWCIYVAWAIVLIVIAVSSFFIILYGLSYGHETSMDWLLASVISIFQSIIVIQTAKIIGASVIATLSPKYLNHIRWQNRHNFLEIQVAEMAKDSDEMRELHYELVRIRKSKQYQPLQEDEITIMKKRTVIKRKAFIFFKGIVSHFIFLTLVLNLAYSTDNINVFFCNRAIANQLSLNLSNVDRMSHVYIWMNTVFLPLIHDKKYPTFLYASRSKIVGLPRIRQVRAKHVEKNCFNTNSFVYGTVLGKSHCLHRYGVDEEDTLNYTDFWESIGSQYSEGFTYEFDTSSWNYYSYGETSIYGTGGYTVYFFPEKDLSNSQSRLDDLQNSAWLDERSWAVMVELTTFNPDVGLFTCISVVFEATPLGIVHTRLSVQSFTLMTFEQLDTMQIITNLIFMVFLFIYIADEIYIIRQQKMGYIKRVSNIINFGLKSVFFAVVFLQVVKFKLALDLLDFYSLHRNQFIPFHAAASVDETLRITVGFLAFFTILKTLRYARFFYSVRLAQRSVSAALPGICSMALIVAVYFFAYMAFGYLVFGQHCWSHSNLSHSAQTVLAYCVSAFRDTVFSNNRILGGIYLISFMLVMICIVINLFQAVIISAYDDMKQPVYEEPSDEAEVMAFLVHKVRNIVASLTSRKAVKREPEILNSLLYGQPDREQHQALGLKTKKVNGKKMVYLLI
ncbi:polycystin family receptor for egg jelly [Ambystoma mexicanum]|uniref:polycystin family receptor for egg jelly n=1 Tax=Ambystoma mexicanum TaxID=8296 RepID=UPI0037E71C05